jgi:CRP-like cAMP-binding protein
MERGRLLEGSRSTTLDPGQVLAEPALPMTSVYFPVDAVICLTILMNNGSTVELAAVGREGMVGLSVFLGGGTLDNVRAITQVPGTSFAVGVKRFDDEVGERGSLADILHVYTNTLLTQAAQEVGCARLHSLEERLSRFLLTTQDRSGTEEFSLTQEFTAEMLGVHRPSVTIAARVLQTAGLISYRRGRVTIVDRDGLESSSCECYGFLASECGHRVEPRPA